MPSLTSDPRAASSRKERAFERAYVLTYSIIYLLMDNTRLPINQQEKSPVLNILKQGVLQMLKRSTDDFNVVTPHGKLEVDFERDES